MEIQVGQQFRSVGLIQAMKRIFYFPDQLWYKKKNEKLLFIFSYSVNDFFENFSQIERFSFFVVRV